MIKIIDTVQRENSEGEVFTAFVLLGKLETIISNSGRKYMSAMKTSIPTTFDEATARSFIGSTLEGEIQRVATEEYDYTVPQTGEVIQISHTYEYVEQPTIKDAVFSQPIQVPI